MVEKNSASQIKEGFFDIKLYVRTCLKKWRWFLSSTLLFVFFTVLYLLIQPPIYERSAQLMIKDNNPASSITAGLSAFQGLGILGGSSNVNNELAAMLTPATMIEVIKRLHTDYEYTERQFLCEMPLYGKTLPVRATITGLGDEDKAAFALELNNGKVNLSDLRKNKDKFDETYDGEVNKPIKTVIGVITISPTPVYTGNEDMTIQVTRTQLYEQSVRQFKKFAAVLDDELAQVITISYKDESAERAVDILNTLIDVYNEEWMRDKNNLTKATSDFINARIEIIEKELSGVEQRLSEYKSRNKLPDIVETAKLQIAKSEEYNSQLVQIQSQLQMATYMRDYLRDNSNKNELMPAKMLLNDPSVEEQIMEYNKLQQQRNRLAANSSEENARVKELDGELKSMRNAILASMDNTIKQLKIQIDGLRHSEQKAENFIEEAPIKGKQLLSAERQQKVQEALYIFLLQKREENVLSQTFTAYNTRLLSPPMGMVRPVFPRRLLLLAGALLMGMALPAIWIFILINVLQTVPAISRVKEEEN